VRYNAGMSKPRSAAPIIAAVLLLLPVLYVGSYLALVEPQPPAFSSKGPFSLTRVYPFRIRSRWLATFYRPLEQIDRHLRPEAWEPAATWEG
jgi:hypothetical protein